MIIIDWAFHSSYAFYRRWQIWVRQRNLQRVDVYSIYHWLLTELKGDPQLIIAFYSHALYSMHRMGNGVARQVFYLTLIAHFKGLSRTGIDIMNKVGGLINSPTYFDVQRGQVLSQLKDRLQ